MQRLCIFLAVAVSVAIAACASTANAALPSGYVRGQSTKSLLAKNWAPGQPGRSWYVHVPTNYDASQPAPVVFSFHGATQSWDDQEDISGLSVDGLTINGKPFIAIYPNGLDGTKGTSAWTGAYYANSSIDDVGFVLRVLQRTVDNLCIDTTRVYASGKSNGGGFTNYLACTPAAQVKFAAFASVSAAIYTDYAQGTNNNCTISAQRGAIPRIDFHGTADSQIEYNGGSNGGYAFLGMTPYNSAWATRDGCTTTTTTTTTYTAGDVTKVSSTGCTNGAQSVHYKIADMDHAWPRTTLPAKCNGTAGNNDCDLTSINATPDYILPFFSQFTLPAALARRTDNPAVVEEI